MWERINAFAKGIKVCQHVQYMQADMCQTSQLSLDFLLVNGLLRLDGLVVSVSDSWPGACEFDITLAVKVALKYNHPTNQQINQPTKLSKDHFMAWFTHLFDKIDLLDLSLSDGLLGVTDHRGLHKYCVEKEKLLVVRKC